MKPLIKVLMLGTQWEQLDQAFASLSSRGIAEFVGPVAPEISEAVAQTDPSAIIVSPGFDTPGQPLLIRPASEQPSFPPILICLDHESLETEELYEYADDFLLVPCSAAEVEKRLRRLILGKRNETPGHVLRLGKITLDMRIYEVRVDNKRVDLAWMEFQLLKFLMEHPGRIFTREELLSSVWSVNTLGGTRTVDVHIRRLRQKLGLRSNTYIRTVSNVGYGLIDA